MDTLFIVLAVLAGVGFVLTCVAFYRGWFRLVSLAGEEQVKFVLMNKEKPGTHDGRNILMSPRTPGPPVPTQVAPTGQPPQSKE